MITLPIYWNNGKKTVLLSINWLRNAYFYEQNRAKQEFHQLVANQLGGLSPITGQFTLSICIYYKNTNCDGSNIASIIEKFILDALQQHSIIINDNVKYHLGSTWSIAGQDKTNPRAEITIKEVLID
jgi:hypothetical protein